MIPFTLFSNPHTSLHQWLFVDVQTFPLGFNPAWTGAGGDEGIWPGEQPSERSLASNDFCSLSLKTQTQMFTIGSPGASFSWGKGFVALQSPKTPLIIPTVSPSFIPPVPSLTQKHKGTQSWLQKQILKILALSYDYHFSPRLHQSRRSELHSRSYAKKNVRSILCQPASDKYLEESQGMALEDMIDRTYKSELKTVGTEVKNSDSLRCADLWLGAGGAVSAWKSKPREEFNGADWSTPGVFRQGKVAEVVKEKHLGFQTLTKPQIS